ncbi:MAG: hypothetical protein ACKOEX_03420 [Planctomycetia bacterium]
MPLAPSDPSFRPGSILVVSLILLGIAAGGLAIGYQRAQTRRCLAFYGPEAARRVSKAATVELVKVAPSGQPGRLVVTDRYDVTSAKGIVHMRRGLVEDAGFRWAAEKPAVALPLESWDYALVFTDSDGSSTTVVVDLDPHGGWLAVVGQGGRVALGRLGRGLTEWIGATSPRR